MLDVMIAGFDADAFCGFLRSKFPSFSELRRPILLDAEFPWDSAEQIGIVKTLAGPSGLNMPLLVVVASLPKGEPLHERSSRLRQFNFARKVLGQVMAAASPGIEGVITQGLFVFHDDGGKFRLSLVYGKAEGTKLVWSTARRLSFHVEVGAGNKTFRDRMALPWASFDKLKEAFSVEKLTKEFYNRLFAWYQWALSDDVNVTYPNNTDSDADDREINEHIIRLITRLMFVWFLKQKHLVPDKLFNPAELSTILKTFSPVSGDNYYRAILQNLFFATLNSEIPERAFAVDAGNIRENKEHFGIKTLYRYGSEFTMGEDDVLALFRPIPFLNGGLFECLDKEQTYVDGFSRNPKKQAHVPNRLFFDAEKGLIPLLGQYNFTVEENSPGDEEVALDPELLGKVFENLLGAYNPETKVAARNATGSFYTPREIVNYMVDESLKAHVKTKVAQTFLSVENTQAGMPVLPLIDALFTDGTRPTDETLCRQIDTALVTAKILDPACGSGAFPMGILLRMVELLRVLRAIPDDDHDAIYDLKLHLIENCIYGGDIQCIAVQITKLRFFISLVCEEGSTGISACNQGKTGIPACKQGKTGIPACDSSNVRQIKHPQTVMTVLPSLTISERKLPHWKCDDAIYWVTFRMADSIPQAKLQAWKQDFELWLKTNPKPWTDAQWQDYDQRFGQPFEKWLDAGMGSCALAQSDVREALADCMLKFHGQRLFLHAAVIMPNHVHCLIEPGEGEDLSKIMQGIKGASARAANKILGKTGTFWMDESYDHIVRSEKQYAHFMRYIEDNPVKAALRNDQYWLHKDGSTGISACESSCSAQTGMSVLPSAANNYGIHTLPNLETKFVAADSLIGLPKAGEDVLSLCTGDIASLREKLFDVRRRHFSARKYQDKKKLRVEDEKLRKAIKDTVRNDVKPDPERLALLMRERAKVAEPDWVTPPRTPETSDLFSEFVSRPVDQERRFDANEKQRRTLDILIAREQNKASIPLTELDHIADMLASWDPYNQNTSAPFSDPEWMFNVKDGFDIVIGNPPYVQIQKLSETVKTALSKQGYKTFAKTADIYCLFYERGGAMLGCGGNLCYITSNKFFRSGYGKPLRHLLTQAYSLHRLIDFGELPVFEAGTDPVIVQFGKTELSSFMAATIKDAAHIPMLREVIVEAGRQMTPAELPEAGWSLSGIAATGILEKMRRVGTPLGEYVNGEIYYGIKTGFNEAFILDDAGRAALIAADPKSAEIIKPLAKGDDVRKWHIRDKGRWLILTKIGTDMTRYPAIMAHLKQWEPQLRKRQDQGNHWWELRACAYYDVFSAGKIIYPVIAKEQRFTWDSAGYHSNDKTYMISGKGRKWFAGILNSKLSWFYLKSICSGFGDSDNGGRLELRSIYISTFPIPPASLEQRKSIECLVNRILAAKILDPSADTSAWEAEIDRLVYALYGLTEEEIAIVEGSQCSADIPVCEKEGNADIPVCEAKGFATKRQTGMSATPSRPRKLKANLPPSLPGWD